MVHVLCALEGQMEELPGKEGKALVTVDDGGQMRMGGRYWC